MAHSQTPEKLEQLPFERLPRGQSLQLRGPCTSTETFAQALAAHQGPPQGLSCFCGIEPGVLGTYLDVDAGLAGSIKYVHDLASEYADYFGNVGMNFDPRGINEAAATAFN